MKEYSIHVSNGKVIGDSAFYVWANNLLSQECKRLCDFTDTLEHNSVAKKNYMAEYKCAKHRYASVSLIHSIVYNNNRCRKLHNIEYSHYVLEPFDEFLKKNTDFLDLYATVSEDEKPDYSLYYAMIAFAEAEIAKLEEKLQYATDWEKIELEERIGGLHFAKACLDQAWLKRKDVSE